jgi:hypothetical protein
VYAPSMKSAIPWRPEWRPYIGFNALAPIFRTRMRLVVGDVFGPWKRDVENGEDGALGLG